MARPPLTEEEKNRICDLWAAGWTVGPIGKAIGRSKDTVCGALRRMGQPKRRIGCTGRSAKENLYPRGEPAPTPRRPHRKRPTQALAPKPPTVLVPPQAPLAVQGLQPGRWTHCQYILNDTKPFLFCSDPCQDGRPYCQRHQKVCYAGRVWSLRESSHAGHGADDQ